MRNRMYGGVRGRKTKVGEKLLRFPPTRFCLKISLNELSFFPFITHFYFSLSTVKFLRGQEEKIPRQIGIIKRVFGGNGSIIEKKRVRHKFMTHPLVLIIFPMLMKYHPENGLARYE